jgi:uncharacterized protein
LTRGFAPLALLMALAAPAAAAAPPPAPERWVTDGAGFLSPATRTGLDRRLESYEQRTGHQVIVWIGTTIGNESLESWAAQTFKAWGIGRKGKDDGVAIFILAQDRRMRIEVGYGVEGQLTDLASARIIREQMTPRLRLGDRDGAVTAAVDGVLGALGGEEPGAAPRAVDQPEAEGRPISLGEIIFLGVVALFVIGFLVTHPSLASALLFTIASGRRGGGGWSGGSSWGGGGGGGGFSGGGGSSGGGGASGSW